MKVIFDSFTTMLFVYRLYFLDKAKYVSEFMNYYYIYGILLIIQYILILVFIEIRLLFWNSLGIKIKKDEQQKKENNERIVNYKNSHSATKQAYIDYLEKSNMDNSQDLSFSVENSYLKYTYLKVNFV